MNRSFRASAPAMDKEDELALFLEVRNREKDRNNLLFSEDDGHKPSSISPLLKTVSSGTMPARRTAVEEFLNSDGDKNDYDWLITPPGTPLFPCLEMEACNRSPPTGHTGTLKSRQNVLKSRLAYSADSSSRNILTSRQVTSSSGLSSSTMGTRRLSSSGGLRAASRPPTPTGRSTSSATSKPSRPVTPTGHATSSATSKPSRPTTPTGRVTSSATLKPSRPTTPTGRVTSSATKPSRPSTPTKQVAPHLRTSAPPRSSTLPSIRSSVSTSIRSSVPSSTRPSTPTSRPSLSAPNKPAPRPATPTRRTSAPSSLPASNAPSARSSPVLKSGHTTSKSSAPSRGTSPLRSRAWKPSDMPGFSLEAPPNLRTSLPERPSSACRGRPGAPISRSSSIVPEPIVRPRRQSCSPSRGRAPNGNGHSGSSVPAVRRPHLNGGDNVSPVLIGSKMVERVVNARKLAPPKQDDRRSSNNSLSGKSSTSPDSVGFGRTMSKKSLDMALRHMDIRRSIPNNLRPLMTNIPPSVYSARSGSTRSRSVSVSGSPMGTSSNASSEQSFNNILCLDGSEMEDDLCSYKGGHYSPAGPLAR